MQFRTVLIIEDNPDDEALMTRALSETATPPRVVFVRDGVDALDLLRKRGRELTIHPPALIVLDLMMPRMNGFEFLRAIRADSQFHHVPVIVFSSSDAPRDIQQAYDLGATSYVQKPTGYHEFSTALTTMVEYWLRLNHTPALTNGTGSTSPLETFYTHPARGL